MIGDGQSSIRGKHKSEAFERRHLQEVWCVLISSPGSIRLGIPSVLGALEAVVAVAAWWTYGLYFNTFTHIWVSICIAPLLLLRSNQSTALGVRWFDRYIQRTSVENELRRKADADVGFYWEDDSSFWVSPQLAWIPFSLETNRASRFRLVPGLILLCCAGWYWLGPNYLRYGYTLWLSSSVLILFASIVSIVAIGGIGTTTLAITRSLMLYLIGFVVVAVPIWTFAFSIPEQIIEASSPRTNTTDLLLAMLLVVGEILVIYYQIKFNAGDKLDTLIYPVSIALGVSVRSIAIRILATARFALYGFWEIPKNFRNSVFATDFAEPARLLPGSIDVATLTKILSARIGTLPSQFQMSRNPEDRSIYQASKKLPTYISGLLFVPAYMYRFSIKATCWLYLPLVYIAYKRNWRISDAHRLDILDNRFEWWRRILAMITLLLFGLTTTLHSAAALAQVRGIKVISLVEYLFFIRPAAVKPWQVLNLVTAVITIILFFTVGNTLIAAKHENSPEARRSLRTQIEWYEFLKRTRNVSSIAFVLILFLHALLLFSPMAFYLPNNIVVTAESFYGIQH